MTKKIMKMKPTVRRKKEAFDDDYKCKMRKKKIDVCTWC